MVIVIVSDHCDKDMSHGVSQNVQDYNCGGVFFLFFFLFLPRMLRMNGGMVQVVGGWKMRISLMPAISLCSSYLSAHASCKD